MTDMFEGILSQATARIVVFIAALLTGMNSVEKRSCLVSCAKLTGIQRGNRLVGLTIVFSMFSGLH